MVEISNYDLRQILLCLDVAITHYRAQPDTRSLNKGRLTGRLKNKLIRKIKNSKQS